MTKNDWIGLGGSILAHAVIFLGFSLMAAAPDEEPYDLIEIAFDTTPAQTVSQSSSQRAEPPTEEAPAQPEPAEQTPPEENPETEEATEVEETPVDPVTLPDPPENETPKPAESTEEILPPPPAEPTEPEEIVQPLGGGGNQGQASEAVSAQPFTLEGLNRIPLRAPLPQYAEKVNAVIKVRITVDPQGRVIRTVPLVKGNPRLEQAVMQALRGWRFNGLPSNAPRENQTGVITFTFRLR